jgi:SAM-dependent methyltransferase
MAASIEAASPRLEAEGYDRLWADTPDFIRYHPGARHRRRIMLRLLRDLKYNRVLDVGCGNGAFLSLLKETGLAGDAVLEGWDMSPDVVGTNVSRIPGMQFTVADIEQAPVPSEKFDLIVCAEVIEHLDDQPKAFAHLAAGLAHGGHLLLTTPTGWLYPTERHFGHTRHMTAPQMRELAHLHGLEVVQLINWGWPFYRILRWATNFNPAWSIRNFASGDYGPMAKFVCGSLYTANRFNVRSSPWGCQLLVLFRRP